VTHLTDVLGAISVATSCLASTDSETGRVVGLIGLGTTTIEAPDTVQVGATFIATVNSFGSSTCTTPDGVELTLRPAEARVTPYDRITIEKDAVCTADLAPVPHRVQLQFTQPGAATIVAEGMVEQASGGRARGTVTKAVVVVP
jgi:hypothetical protein